MQRAQPPVASWAQMAEAMAASWTSPRGSHFGVIAYLLWPVEGPGLRQPGVPVLLGYGLPHLCSRLGGSHCGARSLGELGPGAGSGQAHCPPLGALPVAVHEDDWQWQLLLRHNASSQGDSAHPGWRGQPETAGQGLHRGIPSEWEGGHSQRPGMAAVGRREAALGLRLEQIPPF